MSRPRYADLSKYPVPAIVEHVIRGALVFDTWARGFPPAEGDRRPPSAIAKWIGRYETRELALAAFAHFKATGERLPGRETKPRADAGTRSTFILPREAMSGTRYDAKGRTVGTPGAVHIGSFTTRPAAEEACASWMADPTFRKRREVQKRQKAVKPRATRTATMPPAPRKRATAPAVAPAPAIFASPQPPAMDPRRRRPGEAFSAWAIRLGLL